MLTQRPDFCECPVNRADDEYMGMDEILTLQEIADYLKVSRTTVWRWCSEGTLCAFKVGKSWRVPRIQLERLIAQSSNQIEKETSKVIGEKNAVTDTGRAVFPTPTQGQEPGLDP